MKKNEIISNLIDRLSKQRDDFGYELRQLNHNENNHIEKKMTLESAIFNIDMKIDSYLMNCEIEPVQNI